MKLIYLYDISVEIHVIFIADPTTDMPTTAAPTTTDQCSHCVGLSGDQCTDFCTFNCECNPF